MYIWGRFVRLVATRRSRPRLEPFSGVSELRLRVWPTDVDPFLHVNNGRYFAIADLGRYDLFLRTRILSRAKKAGIEPIMGGAAAEFRRELKLWSRFTLRSRFVGAEGRRLVGEHAFVRDDGKPAATLVNTVGFYERAERRFLAVETAFARLGLAWNPPAIDAPAEGVLHALDGLRTTAVA